MHWHSEFQSEFFGTWVQEGLAHPEKYESQYTAELKSNRYCGENPVKHSHAHHPLRQEILDSVYGFGFMVGKTCAELFTLTEKEKIARASWCGRFNLGISLFDYICDESGRSSILPDLPAFEFLRKQPRNNNTPISKNEYPIEWLLNNLAQTVLDELAVEIGTPVWTKKRNGLWDALRSMFEAELMVTTSPDGTKENLQQIKRALCLKSAEPFRIMAEFVALGATKKDRPSKLRKARAYGRALGRCYWLIDDAKDIWADFDKKQWNIFLVHVAEKEPDLFMRSRDAITDFHLAKTLMKLRLSKKESVYAIQRLIHSLDELTINSQIREKIEGYIAASLLRWYRFG